MEGVVAKRHASRYRSGERAWVRARSEPVAPFSDRGTARAYRAVSIANSGLILLRARIAANRARSAAVRCRGDVRAPPSVHGGCRDAVRADRVSRAGWTLVTVGAVVVAMRSKRGRRARKVYVEEVSSGSKPIEAVGTAIAAFVGPAPDPPPPPPPPPPPR
jgi:hypothetical protein